MADGAVPEQGLTQPKFFRAQGSLSARKPLVSCFRSIIPGVVIVCFVRTKWPPLPQETSDGSASRHANAATKSPTTGACAELPVHQAPSGHASRHSANRRGYALVKLNIGVDRTRLLVHILVLEAFRGPRPPGTQTRHLNGISNDNRLVNLAWGTPKENAADCLRQGTRPLGSRRWNAKLREGDVVNILTARAAGTGIERSRADMVFTTTPSSRSLTGKRGNMSDFVRRSALCVAVAWPEPARCFLTLFRNDLRLNL